MRRSQECSLVLMERRRTEALGGGMEGSGVESVCGGGKSTSAGDEEVHGGEAAHAGCAEQPSEADTKQGGTAMRNATCAPPPKKKVPIYEKPH